LLVALPLFGVKLHLQKTLVILTFVFGLIPVLGNLISNTAIVVISLGYSMPVAVSSLVYLIVIHKLEYFLNAKIVGGHIHAAAWEILAAMVILEAAFGIAGVVAAPILYAYVKGELTDRRLI
jgi:predicted PurR-regulated permease PerM